MDENSIWSYASSLPPSFKVWKGKERKDEPVGSEVWSEEFLVRSVSVDIARTDGGEREKREKYGLRSARGLGLLDGLSKKEGAKLN